MWLQRLEGRELVFEGFGRTERHEVPAYLRPTWRLAEPRGDVILPESLVLAAEIPDRKERLPTGGELHSTPRRHGIRLYRGSSKEAVSAAIAFLENKRTLQI